MHPKRIKTLAELREEQINLKIRIAGTQKELLKSATEIATASRHFLFQKVMLPAGAAGLGIAARNIFGASAKRQAKQEQVSHGSGHWLMQLLLMGLPMLQQVLSQAIAGREEEDTNGYEAMHASSAHEKEEGVDWLQALLPIGITLLRNFIESKIDEDDAPAFHS